MDAVYGTTGIPRYWITLGKEIIWDYPKDFVSRGYLDRHLPYPWPYRTDISEISCLIREYLDTPRSQILLEPFENDLWGIVNILRAADRRVGSRQWDELERSATSEAVTKILARANPKRQKRRKPLRHRSNLALHRTPPLPCPLRGRLAVQAVSPVSATVRPLDVAAPVFREDLSNPMIFN